MVQLTPVQWISDDPLTLHELAQSGLTTEFHMIPHKEIDASGRNKAREHAKTDEAQVERLAIKMDAGNPMKAVVVCLLQRHGSFRYRLVHGFRRHRAYGLLQNDDLTLLRSKDALIGAHVIQSTYTDDVEEYERFANYNEGVQKSPAFALHDAVWLIRSRKASYKYAERRTGVRESKIREAVQAEDRRAELEREGVDTSELSDRSLVRIGALRYPEHRKNLARVATELKLPTDEVSTMVAEVNRHRNRKTGAQIIHDHYATRRHENSVIGNGEKADQRRRRLFLQGFRRFEDLWLKGNDGRPIKSLSDVGISPTDRELRDEMIGRARDLFRLMRQVMRIKE